MKLAFLTTDNREPYRQYDRPDPWFGTAPAALLQGFAGMPGLEVHVIGCTQQPMRSPEKLADNIYFHSLHVPKMGWMRTLYQGCIRATRRKLREINPDMVHGQGTERECSISAVLSGFPNVVTIHGNMRVMADASHARPFSFYWLAARLEAATLRRTRGIVCITEYTKRLVEPLNSRTWVLPNAVDSTFFEITAAPATPPIILCIGNVTPRKNQNAFIRALDALVATHPFRLRFFGGADPGNPYAAEFLELVRTRSWCEFLGFADRDKLRSHFAAATGLVLPSHEDNCPMVVLEAMAAGIPCAASRVGGIPELIREGENGFLFDPGSGEEMSQAVRRLLEETAANHDLATRARTEAARRFHPRVIAQGHVEIYEEVLSEEARR